MDEQQEWWTVVLIVVAICVTGLALVEFAVSF